MNICINDNGIPTTQGLRNSFNFDFSKYSCVTNFNVDKVLSIKHIHNINDLLMDKFNKSNAFSENILSIHFCKGDKTHIFQNNNNDCALINSLNLVNGETVSLIICYYWPNKKDFNIVAIDKNSNDHILCSVEENGSLNFFDTGVEGEIISLDDDIYELRVKYLINDSNKYGLGISSQKEQIIYIGEISFLMSDKHLEDVNLQKDNVYQEVWNHDGVIYNESVMFYEHDDHNIYGRLLYNPSEIISVTTCDMSKNLNPKDFKVENKKMTTSLKIKYLTQDNINCVNVPDCFKAPGNEFGVMESDKVAVKKILFTETKELYDYCYLVTYKTKDKPVCYKAIKQGNNLPRTKDKLITHKPLNLVVFGDSISAGCHSSGNLDMYPYHPIYPQAFANEISRKYHLIVNLSNPSVGGTLSDWGMENAGKISNKNTDLVVVAFGMNDGTFLVPLDIFKGRIASIMNQVRESSPNCDIILVSTMIANPISLQSQLFDKANQISFQEKYLDVLQELTNEYKNVALCDMTTLSKLIFNEKDPLELLANNINHPNDFLVRQYVAVLMNCLDFE